eukprot:symbB.v1.2.022230.t1/scaffold1961.1/size94642/6
MRNMRSRLQPPSVERRICFDVTQLKLREKAMELLEKASDIGSFKAGGCLEEYEAQPAIFRSFALRSELHRLVASNVAFLEVYEELVLTVLLPWLKDLLLEGGVKSSSVRTAMLSMVIRQGN